MTYKNVIQGRFLNRPNRFVAVVDTGEGRVTCHVKNTGRLGELLIPGETDVYLEDHGSTANRKTRYSLISVQKNGRYINIDSSAPNKVVGEWLREGSQIKKGRISLFSDLAYLKAEQRYHLSRFDFYLEENQRKIWMEVKGVTLVENGVAKFPDAPTKRGIKHIEELVNSVRDGYEAYLLFVIALEGVKWMEPNEKAQPAFKEALQKAVSEGVHLIGLDCLVGPDYMKIKDVVEIKIPF